MQGVQSSYKTDRGVKGTAILPAGTNPASIIPHQIVCSKTVRSGSFSIYIGGATGNIRARFEQMAKDDEVGGVN